ncbi:heavy metal translocating P-type ATPase [Permianibacter aggregans]|uniref:Cu2+-exporting ATPase n=1 Tax=Permianibacter aggregans TaxID=1510150 RepID=A0A4V3D6X9_9GAMM|nr:heavy metal translocating P-type ATPase [Permianibacter aggregans]QGX41616.1 cadmium-translocating P-type ATPase [Permianibacter aggregans]TDQ45687.1 Cu2+-exporting ATPase [Permianibacter aggregans]
MSVCFHCHEPVLTGQQFMLKQNEQALPFCCAGCKAVAETIFAAGLDSYYQHRAQPASRSDAAPPEALWQALARSAEDAGIVQHDGDNTEADFFVEQLQCPACAWLIERHLRQLPGVSQVQVQLSDRKLTLHWCGGETDMVSLLSALHQIGYQAVPFSADAMETALAEEQRYLLKRLAVAGFGMMQSMMYAFGLYFDAFSELTLVQENWLRWSSMLVTLPVVLYSGQVFFRRAWSALKMRSVTMDTSVSIAILLAFFASLYATLVQQGQIYFDSVGMFVFLLLLGRFLELRARQRVITLSGTQHRLLPRLIERWQDDCWQISAVSALQSGDRIRIKAGEVCPVDGDLLSSKATVVESQITGESDRIGKQVNARIFAGSLVADNAIELRVENAGTDTYLSQLSRLSEQALQHKPGIQLWADKVARYFIAGILLIAAIVFAVWLFVEPNRALDITIAVLVVTCPCALSLALPTAWASAIRFLLQKGVLIRRAEAMEQLLGVTDIVFDKTGTLTTGEQRVAAMVRNPRHPDAHRAEQLAASLEHYSTHPLAKALAGVNEQKLRVDNIQEFPGQGMSGEIDGKPYRIGSAEFIDVADQGIRRQATVVLADEKDWIASFTLTEKMREQTEATLQWLQSQGYRLHLLSGDNEQRVWHVAQNLPLAQYRYRCLPEQKMQYVQALQKEKRRVLMIGDGVNDAAVLAASDVSMAMGSAADVSRLNADIILLHDQLPAIAATLRYAGRTQAIIRQNLSWALLYNVIAIPFACIGWISPWLAALGMTASSLWVTLNSCRLAQQRQWQLQEPMSPPADLSSTPRQPELKPEFGASRT